VLAADPLTDDKLATLVANLRSAPLGVDERVRVSLAGVQEKLVLTRLPGGGWGRPVAGAPSTHILKPAIAAYPQTVENEAFCMRVARHLGLPVADVETTQIAGRSLIVISRFDRVVEPSGVVRRQHQEDVCQAMGLLPSRKYQDDGGPSLAQMAVILKAFDADSLATLVQATTFNVVVGNGDAHGKNFSLLHSPNGTVRLAPLYDLLSTLLYDDDRLAMHIDNVRRTNRVTAGRIVNEAVSWGLARQRAGDLVGDVLDRLPDAVAHAADETPGVPGRLLEIIDAQLRAVLAPSAP
jgi:serine/threonine-protein kinase HipA